MDFLFRTCIGVAGTYIHTYIHTDISTYIHTLHAYIHGGGGLADAAGRERSAVCFIVFFHVCNRLTFVNLKTVNTRMVVDA